LIIELIDCFLLIHCFGFLAISDWILNRFAKQKVASLPPMYRLLDKTYVSKNTLFCQAYLSCTQILNDILEDEYDSEGCYETENENDLELGCQSENEDDKDWLVMFPSEYHFDLEQLKIEENHQFDFEHYLSKREEYTGD